jgi:hypothetical protein
VRWAHQKITQTFIYQFAKKLKAKIKAVIANWFK